MINKGGFEWLQVDNSYGARGVARTGMRQIQDKSVCIIASSRRTSEAASKICLYG